MKHFHLFIILFLAQNLWAQEDSILQALRVEQLLSDPKTSIADTPVVHQLWNEQAECVYIEPLRAQEYSRKGYALSLKIDYKKGIVHGLSLIGSTKIMLAQYDSAEFYADKAIELSKKYQLSEEEMFASAVRGNIHFYRAEYEDALNRYFDAVEIADRDFPEESPGAYGRVGLIFIKLSNYKKAEEYLEEGYQRSVLYKDTSARIFLLNNLGIAAKNQENYDAALKHYQEGLDLAVATGNLKREGEIIYNMSTVYFNINELDKAFKALERSSEITHIIGNDRDLSLDYYNLAMRYAEAKKYKEAEKYALLSEQLSRKTEYWEVELESMNVLADIYFYTGKYLKAYEYRSLAYYKRDSLDLTLENSKALEIENQFELEKQALADSLEREKINAEIAYKDKLSKEKLKSRELMLILSALALIIALVAGIVLFGQNKKVKAKNAIIEEQNEEVNRQKEEIEEQHKEITDSINYAVRIQEALLSSEDQWQKVGADHFIFFKPKDVVSGDFYWTYHFEEEKKSIWVTADCTGHGVPGAFMSMLGISFLNEIVVERGARDGGLILDQLRTKIVQALAQNNQSKQQKDGMDLTLCILDHTNHVLEYTGANNPLWLFRKSTSEWVFEEFRPNKMPVGFHTEMSQAFESHSIQLQPGDQIFTFTDGYADQFGGDKGKKLKYKPFRELLLENINLPLKEQSSILDKAFESWKGDLEQIDDVCVIGVKI